MYNATGFGNTYVKQFAKIDFFDTQRVTTSKWLLFFIIFYKKPIDKI